MVLTLSPGVTGVPFASTLAGHGERIAVISPSGTLTYRDLAMRVDELAQRLGPHRRLVLLAAGSNTLDSVVGYLAALTAGHPLLLTAATPRHVESLVDTYDPDVVLTATGPEPTLRERRARTVHELHPDLALLLSTSGSTGAPKLVRLSGRNLQSNAEAIADYLNLREDDRAATTLPMHYCYGLSVINSHLLRGAGLILTDLSVADRCFWDLFREHRATSFAGVPYTFDLLDRIGFDRMSLPHLRRVTQAGGRLAPDRVRRYAALGRDHGWEFFVMYGQTEATARMAYLPPNLAESHPGAIGVPIPGGSFRLGPLPEHPEPDTGELIYSGPNVMLGYAETPADLSLGQAVTELRTGDIARRASGGVYQIIGRRSRFLKIFGQRIDLDWLETRLAARGVTICCAGTDRRLMAAVEPAAHRQPQAQAAPSPSELRQLLAREAGLPRRLVTVRVVDRIPRLPSGKPDHLALLEMTDSPPAPSPVPRRGPGDLRTLFAEVLDRPDVTDDSSFVSLGGDSLSYVELSVRLEQALGRLPAEWHTMSIRDLRQAHRAIRRRLPVLETSVLLRAIAIVLIVGTHIKVFGIVGGAHLLIGVAGYNFARFHLSAADRDTRVRHLRRSITRIAVPTMAWIAAALLLTDDYRWPNLLLLNSLIGPRGGRSEWHFWFVESLVYILVVLGLALRFAPLDRLERRAPFGLPVVLLAAGLIMRYDLLGIADRDIPSAIRVFWLFALGWAGAKAATTWQRAAVSVATAVTVPGFFGQPQREAIIILGMLLVIWVPTVPSLPGLNRVAALLAAGSLHIYVTHWQVFPRVTEHSRPMALLVSLLVGLGYAALVGWVASLLRSRWTRADGTRPGWSTRTILARGLSRSSPIVGCHGVESGVGEPCGGSPREVGR